MSEKQIITSLWGLLIRRDHKFIVPNVFLVGGESDLISITEAGYVYEWEIKISASDFRAEFKGKEKKHKALNGEEVVRYPEYMPREFAEELGVTVKIRTPNYFSFVLTEEVYEKVKADIPNYAGIYTHRGGYYSADGITEIRRPKRIKKEKMATEKLIREIARKLSGKLYTSYFNDVIKQNEMQEKEIPYNP